MRTISNILAAVLLPLCASLTSTALAQDPAQMAFIRYINAIQAGEGKAKLILDGADVFPKGYDLGQFTGAHALKAGSHSMEIRKTGIESGSTKLDLKAGETLSLISFAEKVPPKKGEEDKPPVWQARILKLKQSEPQEKGFQMTIVSVSEKEEIKCEVHSAEKKEPMRAFAKRLSTTSVKLGVGSGDSFLKVNGEELTSLSPDAKGNYVVIIYDTTDGKLAAISFFDPKFVIAG